jgi:hypothetical protein
MDFLTPRKAIFIVLVGGVLTYRFMHSFQETFRSSIGITTSNMTMTKNAKNDDPLATAQGCHSHMVYTTPVTEKLNNSVPELIQIAESGEIWAQWELGEIYSKEDVENSENVTQNYHEAAKWYRMVADQGSSCGQGRLGELYLNGLGVPQSYEDAYFWLRLSAGRASKDHQYFDELLAKVEPRLTLQQLTELNKRVAAWHTTK